MSKPHYQCLLFRNRFVLVRQATLCSFQCFGQLLLVDDYRVPQLNIWSTVIFPIIYHNISIIIQSLYSHCIGEYHELRILATCCQGSLTERMRSWPMLAWKIPHGLRRLGDGWMAERHVLQPAIQNISYDVFGFQDDQNCGSRGYPFLNIARPFPVWHGKCGIFQTCPQVQSSGFPNLRGLACEALQP